MLTDKQLGALVAYIETRLNSLWEKGNHGADGKARVELYEAFGFEYGLKGDPVLPITGPAVTATEVQRIWDEENSDHGPRAGMDDMSRLQALCSLVRRVTIRALTEPLPPVTGTALQQLTRCGCADNVDYYRDEAGIARCTDCRLPVDFEARKRNQVPTPPEHVAGRLLGLPADLEDALRLLVREYTDEAERDGHAGFVAELPSRYAHAGNTGTVEAWATVRRRLGLPDGRHQP